MSRRVIHIKDIPLKAFLQFESGRRFSAEINLDFTPVQRERVVLSCEKLHPPLKTPDDIRTSVKNVVYLDTMLTSKNFYSLTFYL